MRRFWDDNAGGFFDTARDLNDRLGNLTMARKPFQDSPTPAGNSVAVLVLDRLASLAARPDFRAKAEETLALFASKAVEYGLFASTYGLALLNHLQPPVEVVVVGEAEDGRTSELLTTAYQTPRAGKRVLAFRPRGDKEWRASSRTRRYLAQFAACGRAFGAGLHRVFVPTACQYAGGA